jgi:hypothetical protein
VPVSIRTFQGPVVQKVLLSVGLKVVEFWAVVRPEKPATARSENSFIWEKQGVPNICLRHGKDIKNEYALIYQVRCHRASSR